MDLQPATDALGSLPYITALLMSGGSITVGRVEPMDNMAVAADASRVFATLVRQDDESVPALLQRLDAAVRESVRTGALVSDLKGSEFVLSSPSAHPRRKRKR